MVQAVYTAKAYVFSLIKMTYFKMKLSENLRGKKQNKRPLGLVMTVGLMINRFRSQELHQNTIC